MLAVLAYDCWHTIAPYYGRPCDGLPVLPSRTDSLLILFLMSPPKTDGTPFEPSPAERERMVAEAAYFLAERRGFAPGSEASDWREAESQIDTMLAAMQRRGISREQLQRTGLRNALLLWVAD